MPDHEGGGRDAVDGAAGGEDRRSGDEHDGAGDVQPTGVVSTLAEIGLRLDETKTLLAMLQASMLCGQVAAHGAHHRACAACEVL
jgi:hypothetical protein